MPREPAKSAGVASVSKKARIEDIEDDGDITESSPTPAIATSVDALKAKVHDPIL